MKGIVSLVLLAALPLVLGGCVELKQDATVNPDGSGKMVIEIAMPAMPPMGMNIGGADAPKPDPDMLLKSFGKKTMDEAKGVETWSDVSLGMTDDGRMKFKGTAYFKDVAKLQVGKSEGPSSGGGVTWVKDPKGGMTLSMSMEPDKDQPKPPAAKPAEMTEEQLTKAVQQAKMEWQQVKPMMQMMLTKMKIQNVFHLPGTLAEVTGFKKEADGSVSVTIEGIKVLDVMDKQMADDAYIKAAIKAGKDPVKDKPSDDVMEKAFGFKGTLSAHVTGDLKPLFDYAKESAAAKAAYPKMIEKLGLDKVPAESGGAMTITPHVGIGSGGSSAPAPMPK
jgi:hypothetical protein